MCEQTLFDRLCEVKNDALDLIYAKILKGQKSNFLNIDSGIHTIQGIVDRIEVDSAGCYVNLNNSPRKLEELQRETIIQIGCFLEGSWNGK